MDDRILEDSPTSEPLVGDIELSGSASSVLKPLVDNLGANGLDLMPMREKTVESLTVKNVTSVHG